MNESYGTCTLAWVYERSLVVAFYPTNTAYIWKAIRKGYLIELGALLTALLIQAIHDDVR